MLRDSWNTKTHVWVGECVYKRVTNKGVKPGFKSSMMTFPVWAIWVSSFSLDVFCPLTDIAPLAWRVSGLLPHVRFRRFRHHSRLSRPFNRSAATPVPGQPATPPSFNKNICDWSGVILTAMLVNYAVAAFILLDSLERSSRVGWYGYIIVGGAMFFCAGGVDQ